MIGGRESERRDERDIWTPSVPSSLQREVVSELRSFCLWACVFLIIASRYRCPCRGIFSRAKDFALVILPDWLNVLCSQTTLFNYSSKYPSIHISFSLSLFLTPSVFFFSSFSMLTLQSHSLTFFHSSVISHGAQWLPCQ